MVDTQPVEATRHVTEPATARARKAMLSDQVRVAYGTVPVILEGLPGDHPVRVRIREDARALLVSMGYLTEAELGGLSVTEATRVAVQRCRAWSTRPQSGRA